MLLVILLGIGLTLNPREVPSPLINKPAPEFTLPPIEEGGKQFTNKDLVGKVSIVNVWATWCPSCRAEHDVLMDMSKTLNIPIYGIDWKDDKEQAKVWLQQLGNPYTAVGFDGDGNVGIDWGVYGAPESYLVDSKGYIRFKYTGPITYQVLNDEIMPRIEKIRNSSSEQSID